VRKTRDREGFGKCGVKALVSNAVVLKDDPIAILQLKRLRLGGERCPRGADQQRKNSKESLFHFLNA